MGKVPVLFAIILVSLNMREDLGKWEIATIGHDILENVRMIALSGYPVRGEVFQLYIEPRDSPRE
jgi:hypothetical protein